MAFMINFRANIAAPGASNLFTYDTCVLPDHHAAPFPLSLPPPFALHMRTDWIKVLFQL